MPKRKSTFDKKVFINCPFDTDYRQMLLAIVFTVKRLGFTPQLTLQSADSSTTRIANIVKLIRTSKFAIHDLSRIMSTKEDEPARMNMPFELGIDFGCKQYKGGECRYKKILVLEAERYRYQAALSDLSGSDIKSHGNEPIKVVKAVRDWFVTEELKTGAGPKAIWYDFNDFNADLADKLIEQGHATEDFESVPVPEVMAYMDQWFAARA